MHWLFIVNNMLLKPKRHSFRCHGFLVHTLLLRMHTNVVYFRVMRRLCRCEWNWLCVNLHPWQWTRDHGVWRLLTLTVYIVVSIYLKEPPPNGTIPESVAQFMESVKSRARDAEQSLAECNDLLETAQRGTMKPCYNGLVLKPMCSFGK